MLPAGVPGQAVTGSDETADVDDHSVATGMEGAASLGAGLSPADRGTEWAGRRGLWIGRRKIMRHPRDFWWIDYALTNHIWIVGRWLYERGLRFTR
jgi:hypothetical protein